MVSPRCVQAVFTALTPIEGIAHVEVRVGLVEVEHDGRATIERLREAIGVVGYQVEPVEADRRKLPVL